MKVNIATTSLGKDARQRQVKLGSNHHLEVLETQDKKGQPCWEGVVVTTYEAMRRLRAKEPVINRHNGEGKEFKFSLAGGEIVEIAEDINGPKELFVIRTVSKTVTGQASVEFVGINDARKKVDIKADKKWKQASVEMLRKKCCRKILIPPLGEIRTAND
jgi:hypothetical protein